jgi:hypothetical protein
VRRIVTVVVVVLGLYLVARAISEPFVIDMSDPATYRDDWAGRAWRAFLPFIADPGCWRQLRW